MCHPRRIPARRNRPRCSSAFPGAFEPPSSPVRMLSNGACRGVGSVSVATIRAASTRQTEHPFTWNMNAKYGGYMASTPSFSLCCDAAESRMSTDDSLPTSAENDSTAICQRAFSLLETETAVKGETASHPEI